MKNQKESKTSELSDAIFSNKRLQFLKDDLGDMMVRIEEMKEQINDKEINSSLDLANQGLGWALNEIEELEDKVDKVIQNVQDD